MRLRVGRADRGNADKNRREGSAGRKELLFLIDSDLQRRIIFTSKEICLPCYDFKYP